MPRGRPKSSTLLDDLGDKKTNEEDSASPTEKTESTTIKEEEKPNEVLDGMHILLKKLDELSKSLKNVSVHFPIGVDRNHFEKRMAPVKNKLTKITYELTLLMEKAK